MCSRSLRRLLPCLGGAAIAREECRREAPTPLLCQGRASSASEPGRRTRSAAISVGCYNVLCSTYAVKWKEAEGAGPDGGSNWALRWPVMRSILGRAQFDVVCLQEVEQADVEEICAGLGSEYTTFFFKHKVRPPDGLMIAVKAEAFAKSPVPLELEHNGVAFGRVDLVHRTSGMKIRVVTVHARGGRVEQLQALDSFADENGEDIDVTIITGDFNEDFGAKSGRGEACSPFPEGPMGSYLTLEREAGLPLVSRPPSKQAPEQKSGKGKIDYIFVRAAAGCEEKRFAADGVAYTFKTFHAFYLADGYTEAEILVYWEQCEHHHMEAHLFRDGASRLAVLTSHAPCSATGHWPSDHGVEALSIGLRPASREA